MPIKAFVFDCGGVLLRTGDISPYAAWEARLGLPSGELERRLWQGEVWALAERGAITDAQFWQQAGHALGLHAQEDVERLREELWTTWELDERVLALVDRARATCKVAILSNATDALEELLQGRYGVADRFDAIVNSARVGIAKPDEGIYQALLAQLDVSASEVVFVDDRAENVAAAAALGMHVAWYVNASELERQLDVYLHRNGRRAEGAVGEGPAEPGARQGVDDVARVRSGQADR